MIPGTRRCRLNQYGRRAVVADDRVVKTSVAKTDTRHLATSFFHRLLDRDRHFTRLALAHADSAVAITNYGECCETKDTTTLHDLRDTVDRNHLFTQAVVAFFLGLVLFTLRFSHR
jgi:hypothetical protein